MLSLVPLPHLQQNDGATKSLSRTFCSPLWIPSGKIDNNYTHLVYNLCRHVGSAALLLVLSMVPVFPFDPTVPTRMDQL